MAHLEIETRDGTHRVQLERDRLSIGRLSYNDVVLPFAQISRQHAELRLISGRWWIADLHSTNGLLLDERRVQEHCLADGDRITLAPGIAFRFVENTQHAPQPETTSGFEQSSGSWARRVREQFAPQTANPHAANPGSAIPQGRTWGPAPSVAPRSPQGPFVPPSSVAPLRPRSPFSDDEVPYVPPAMQPPLPPAYPDDAAPSPLGVEDSPWPPAVPHVPLGGNQSNIGASGGYPAPPGPFHAGFDPHDPYMREAPADERHRNPSGQPSTLLHVCRTCGQLTAPDSVYCQNCHHSIASECSNCRLSLLPVQERCPRCHTPNEASVRRSHHGQGDA